MNCRNCGTENLDNSTFCKSCGTRLDGKKVCPKCKELVDEDNVFCVHCGTNLNTNEVSSTSNEVEKTRDSSSKTSFTSKSIFKNLAFYLGLAAILLCLLFTFFIGISPYVSGDTSIRLTDSYYIYYFLYEPYSYMSTGLTLAYYLAPNLFGTTIVVVFLILTLVAAVFTIKSFIKCFSDESYLNKFMKWSLVSYFIYICFVVFMHQLLGESYSYTSSSLSYSYGYGLNGATVAGVTLSSITMCASLVFYALYKFKDINKQYICNGIRTLLILIVGVVGLGLLSLASINCFQYVIYSRSYINTSITYGIYSFLDYLYTLIPNVITSSFTVYVEYYIPTIIALILIASLTFLFMVIFVLIIKDLLVDFGQEGKKRVTKLGIVLGVILIVIGVLQTFLLAWSAPHYLGEYNNYRYILPIALMVVGILFIILVCVSSAVVKANKGTEQLEEVQEA